MRGLRSKTSKTFKNSLVLPYDLFALTETWLNATILDTELFDNEFLVFRKDRHVDVTNSVGGGVLIAVRSNFCSTQIVFPFNLTIDLLCVKITKESLVLFVLNVYIPPKSPASVYTELSLALDFIFSLASLDSKILLLGDFNLPHIEWVPSDDESYFEASTSSPQQELQMLDNIISTDLQQISCIRNNMNRQLDLVFSSDAVSTVVVESISALSNIDQYHPPLDIFLDLSGHLLENSNPHDCSYTFDFRRGDFQQLLDSLIISGIERLPISNDLDKTVSSFYSILMRCINETVPKKRSIPCNSSCHPWFTKELKCLRNKRNKAWKKYIRFMTVENQVVYISLLEEFKKLSYECYNDYLQTMGLSLKLDPKNFWKFINSKKKSDGYPVNLVYNDVILSTTTEICEGFANNFSQSFIDSPVVVDDNYFQFLRNCPQVSFNNITIDHDKILDFLSHLKDDYSIGPDGIPPALLKKCKSVLALPLRNIFVLSLKLGKFPAVWKKAFLTPVFKKGDKANITNYRPISKLSCIPKLFEQVVCDSLTFICKTIICNQQHGFMQKRSTVTNLVVFLNKCLNSLESCQEVDCVYTDFSKAFDQLSHEIIKFKLHSYGFPPPFIKWISSYLEDRLYQVKFRNSYSREFIAKSGVPQGSHLGPLLFTLAINDAPLCVRNSEILIFADDMKIYKNIVSSNDRALLQDDINHFALWCEKNSLNLNPTKCQTMTFSKKRSPYSHEYVISRHILTRVMTVRDLGVLFTPNLDFSAHINKIVNKANSMLGFIKRWSKEFVDPNVTRALYNSLVRPHLEYASQVWTPLYDIHIERLESVQRNFTRFALKGLQWNDPSYVLSYDQRLSILQMQTLEQRRTNNDLVFFHQLITGVTDAPDLLCSVYFNYRGGGYNLRGLDMVKVPTHRTNYGIHEPLTRMGRLVNWNSNIFDFNINKCKLKNLLKTSGPRS